MNDMPTIWLWISGIFFFLGILVFFILGIVLLRFSAQMNEVLESVKKTTKRLEDVTEKLETTAASAKRTVDHVGTKARNVADGIEAVAMVSAQRFQMFSTLLTATSTVFKIMQMVKSSKAEKTKVDKRALNKDNKDSNRGVEQPGSSSGS
jgi:sugar-specific transcriptional regulator TrmB